MDDDRRIERLKYDLLVALIDATDGEIDEYLKKATAMDYVRSIDGRLHLGASRPI